jgi:hypothetical protein
MNALHLLAAAALLTGPAELHTLGSPATQEAREPVAKRLTALIDRYNKQNSDAYELYTKATTEEARAAAIQSMPGKEYLPEFRALAVEAKGTDTAVQAWLWVVRIGVETQEAREILALLLAEHIQSHAMSELCGELRYGAEKFGQEPTVDALRALVADSPHEKVRASALFTLGTVLLASKHAESKAEGRDCLEAVMAEYGELAYGGNSTYAKAAAGFLYELDHLQIGMAAPDFATVDENGAPWKLSDYRGKVVVVDFWGFW